MNRRSRVLRVWVARAVLVLALAVFVQWFAAVWTNDYRWVASGMVTGLLVILLGTTVRAWPTDGES